MRDILLRFEAAISTANDAHGEIPGPLRAMTLLTAALAVTDGFKAKLGAGVSTSEEEWIAICRRAYQRLRSPAGSGN